MVMFSTSVGIIKQQGRKKKTERKQLCLTTIFQAHARYYRVMYGLSKLCTLRDEND